MSNQKPSPEAPTENWQYILLNGLKTQYRVKNAHFEKGRLVQIEDLEPFSLTNDKGERIQPSAENANQIKRARYAEFFKKPFKNLLILTGAGSSIDIGAPLMSHLWKQVEDKFKNGDEDGFKLIREKVGYSEEKQDIEALLSRLDGHCKFSSDKKVIIDGVEVSLDDVKAEIFNIIKISTSISKPTTQYPHKLFLEKLLQRKQTNPRVKIFTLNYDLAFEYASTDVNAIVIDGFSFTFPRTFSGRLFDLDIVQREGSKLKEEDNFIQRVLHLHKLHGSLNWERDANTGTVYQKEAVDKPLIVYPRETKYEDSYEQPFFEMMARFQRSLRVNNDTLLICIGYSFNDKHINAALEEALNQNPGFRLAVIDPYFDNPNGSVSLSKVVEAAKESERIIMISETFTDFANYYPEIQTYDNEDIPLISLKNERQQD
jgi:hypothetical protein